jgi:hypothetical protein
MTVRRLAVTGGDDVFAVTEFVRDLGGQVFAVRKVVRSQVIDPLPITSSCDTFDGLPGIIATG